MSMAINAEERDFRSAEGTLQVRVTFDDGKVVIRDPKEQTIEITDAQARWLSTELDNQLTGGEKRILDGECIVFYSGKVNDENVKVCQKELLKLAFVQHKKKPEERQPITLFINTYGGAVSEAFALMGTIEFVKGLGIPVVGIVSTAYSAGALFLQACSLRLVDRYGRLMLHSVAALSIGKLEQMEEQMEEFSITQERIAEVFAKRNTKGKNDSKHWFRYMKGKDRYLTGAECVDLGLADAVYVATDKFAFPMELAEKYSK